jgi:hypothetical protein
MNVKTERVIVEREDQGWLVMWPTGDVEWFPTKAKVERAIAKRLDGADILVTTVEWRDR